MPCFFSLKTLTNFTSHSFSPVYVRNVALSGFMFKEFSDNMDIANRATEPY